MRCNVCNAENSDNSKFCQTCGSPLNAENTTNEAYQENPQPTPPPTPQPAPMPQQPQYNAPPAQNLDYTPISMWGYFGYELLFSIPCVGFICLLIFSFGGTKNVNLRNFARSYFCFLIVLLIIVAIFAVIAGAAIGSAIGTGYYY